MKIYPDVPLLRARWRICVAGTAILAVFAVLGSLPPALDLSASEPAEPVQPAGEPASPAASSVAKRMVERAIEQLAFGAAFDAKIRQRVWVSGREVVGVGTYEQAGRGSACFNLQLTMHDGDGQHALQQVSDGRLAWTRQSIGGEVALKRVDVGRLDQWVQDNYRNLRSRRSPLERGSSAAIQGNKAQTTATGGATPWNGGPTLRPSVRVGGLAEMLDQISRNYYLELASGSLESREVWIVTGTLNDQARQRWGLEVATESASRQRPGLLPTRVIVAIAKADQPETDFGQGLPIRIEYWSDPIAPEPTAGTRRSTSSNKTDANASGKTDVASKSRLISLFEVYSLRPITAPPIERFRFDNLDAEVNFINETDRYLARYGIRLTERQSRSLRR